MLAQRLSATLESLANAATAGQRPQPSLLAVSKTQPIAAITSLAAAGQRAFGENYVQEAQHKVLALAGGGLEWHLIGHLQSNKAELAASLFDWVQTVDRTKLVEALGRYRPADRPPLNVLVQVNIDDEAGKHGCPPQEVPALVVAIARHPRLRLRGLMAIPTPHAQIEARRPAYRDMASLFRQLSELHPGLDTLSMGMSDDYALAIEEGATMVRIGTALFGTRPPAQ